MDNYGPVVLIDELHRHPGKTLAQEGDLQNRLARHDEDLDGGNDKGNNDNGYNQWTGINSQRCWFTIRYLCDLTGAFLAIGFAAGLHRKHCI
jgi:hypothetical protein